MSDVLRRALAPLSERAWELIDSEVRDALSALLTARRIVDFEGPHGYEHASVSLGRVVGGAETAGVRYGVRAVQPLIEARVDFQLDLDELENLHRGALDVNLDPAREAAIRLANFEEKFVYDGFAPGAAPGMLAGTAHEAVPLGDNPAHYLASVAQAMQVLVAAGVIGPYALVLGHEHYQKLLSDVSTYPPRQRIAKLVEGPILSSQCLTGGVLVSMRGGDLRLDVGQDVAVGYWSHSAQSVDLFLIETLTFRVLDGEAAVKLV